MSTTPRSDGIAVTGEATHTGSLSMADLCALGDTIDDGVQGRSVAVGSVISHAAPTAEATHCTVIATGGVYRASIPIPDLAEKGWISFTDVPDPDTGPADRTSAAPEYRLTVAGGDTLCWNVKDVAELHFSVGPEPDDVPENPPH